MLSRFSVLIEIYFGFAVLGDFLCSFSVSNSPQCPTPAEALMKFRSIMQKNLSYFKKDILNNITISTQISEYGGYIDQTQLFFHQKELQ